MGRNDLADAARETALQLLQATPQLLQLTIERFPQSALEIPADGEWSPRDLAIHFTLSGRKGSFTRIRSIVNEDSPALPDIDENQELSKSGLHTAPIRAILQEFAEQRAEDIRWLRSLDDAVLTRSGRHSEVGPVTADELLYHAANHDCVHLRQLIGMLQQQLDPVAARCASTRPN